jgi:hypothetical protein
LEDKNASAGFWSGLVSGAGQAFKSAPNGLNWAESDLAQGVVGGLGSMNKEGSGFITGFVTAETTALDTYTNSDSSLSTPWKDVLNVAEGSIGGGFASRLGGKTFSSGLFTGFGAEALQDGIFGLEKLAGDPEKPPVTTGPVNSAFKLLQPKTVKGHVNLPLDSIRGGGWAAGSAWSALY